MNNIIHGCFIKGHKYGFEGANTRRSIIWKVSGDSYAEIYNRLIDMEVISCDNYIPDIQYILDKIGKTEDDFIIDDEFDIDSIYNSLKLTDEDYRFIIGKEDGNAYYQSWYEWDEDEEDFVSHISEIKKLRKKTGLTQEGFSDKYKIPKRTIQNWEASEDSLNYRECPSYVISLLNRVINEDYPS